MSAPHTSTGSAGGWTDKTRIDQRGDGDGAQRELGLPGRHQLGNLTAASIDDPWADVRAQVVAVLLSLPADELLLVWRDMFRARTDLGPLSTSTGGGPTSPSVEAPAPNRRPS